MLRAQTVIYNTDMMIMPKMTGDRLANEIRAVLVYGLLKVSEV
jgi:hypothetical protein